MLYIYTYINGWVDKLGSARECDNNIYIYSSKGMLVLLVMVGSFK